MEDVRESSIGYFCIIKKIKESPSCKIFENEFIIQTSTRKKNVQGS